MTDPTREENLSLETLAARGPQGTDPVTGAIMPSLQPSTTFARDGNYRLVDDAHGYARDESPGFLPAEDMLARLEGGAGALLFASGMAAAAAVVRTLAPGERLVAPTVMYWGLRKWLLGFCRRYGLRIEFYDPSDAGALAACVSRAPTRLVWVETPCNPTWDIVDIATAARVAKAAGARLVVDSTVPTPVLTRPLALGADIVVHSATKYLNGHSDVVAGAAVTAREDEWWAEIREQRAQEGAVAGPFEAWLLQRGMRTLFLRVRRASASALLIARHFDGHPRLERVLYPGLPGHPGHAVAAGQMQGGFGGMLSFLVKGGAGEALAVAGRCRLFLRATSLGGVESLIEHRRTIEGEDSPVPANLLRLSVGIEDPADLVRDLERALG